MDVSYRKRGDMAWRAGLPLLRLHGEQVYRRNIFNLVVPNLFAGSIVDLESDTTYEAPNNTTINATTTFEGTYYLTADGTPEQPIVISATGDGEVIIDGRGNFNLFNVKAADYTYFEGLTFRNTDIAIWAGTQAIAGAKGLTVKRCRFEDVGMGVFTNYSGSTTTTTSPTPTTTRSRWTAACTTSASCGTC